MDMTDGMVDGDDRKEGRRGICLAGWSKALILFN